MKIALCLTLLIMISGCATPYARQWKSQLWQVPDKPDDEIPELGTLETGDLTFGVICAGFRQVDNPNNIIMAVSVSCLNKSPDTYFLDVNPIQVIDASNSIVKSLPLDTVMYKFYGGNLRQLAQVDRLNTPPLIDYGDSLADSIITAVVNAYRSHENAAIISELHDKESLPHDLYYRSFDPVSLPPGVSTQWTEYFPLPATGNTITVMLRGDRIENAVMLSRPPPPPPPSKLAKAVEGGSAVVGALLIGIIIVIIAFNAAK